MRHLLDGARPKKPIFAITRGYTEELWEMTISCWEEDPAKRPMVDYVLGVLSSAAERWEPKCGGFSTQHDTEESDSEYEDEPDITSASTTVNPPTSKELTPLDGIADQLLVRAESSLREDGAQEVAEALEKVSWKHLLPTDQYTTNGKQMLKPHCQISPRTRSRCLQGLVKICGEHGILPNSRVISESTIEKLGDSPVSSGGFSSVWRGVYKGDTSVAIKVMRHRRSHKVEDIKQMKEVRYSDPLSSRLNPTVCRTFSERS